MAKERRTLPETADSDEKAEVPETADGGEAKLSETADSGERQSLPETSDEEGNGSPPETADCREEVIMPETSDGGKTEQTKKVEGRRAPSHTMDMAKAAGRKNPGIENGIYYRKVLGELMPYLLAVLILLAVTQGISGVLRMGQERRLADLRQTYGVQYEQK